MVWSHPAAAQLLQELSVDASFTALPFPDLVFQHVDISPLREFTLLLPPAEAQQLGGSGGCRPAANRQHQRPRRCRRVRSHRAAWQQPGSGGGPFRRGCAAGRAVTAGSAAAPGASRCVLLRCSALIIF